MGERVNAALQSRNQLRSLSKKHFGKLPNAPRRRKSAVFLPDTITGWTDSSVESRFRPGNSSKSTTSLPQQPGNGVVSQLFSPIKWRPSVVFPSIRVRARLEQSLHSCNVSVHCRVV